MRSAAAGTVAAAVGVGTALAAVVYLTASRPGLAVGVAVVYALATAMLLQAGRNLERRADYDGSSSAPGWFLGFVLLATAPGTFLPGALDLPTLSDRLAVVLLGAGIALGGFAAGIGATLAWLDDPDRPRSDDRATEPSDDATSSARR